MSAAHDAELTAASLRMAATRGGQVNGVIFHSDRGSEYTAADYADICTRLGVVQSMGWVALALDNAAAEAVNSILKTEFNLQRPPPARLVRRHQAIDHERRQEINNVGYPSAA